VATRPLPGVHTSPEPAPGAEGSTTFTSRPKLSYHSQVVLGACATPVSAVPVSTAVRPMETVRRVWRTPV
jgi:hypothetical protein